MRLEDVSHKWEKIIDKKSIRENNSELEIIILLLVLNYHFSASLLQRVQTVLKVQSTAVNE